MVSTAIQSTGAGSMKKAFFLIRGKKYLCFILSKYKTGTVDVQIIESGLCFRVSGLSLIKEDAA
jgi:hypothetical protein